LLNADDGVTKFTSKADRQTRADELIRFAVAAGAGRTAPSPR